MMAAPEVTHAHSCQSWEYERTIPGIVVGVDGVDRQAAALIERRNVGGDLLRGGGDLRLDADDRDPQACAVPSHEDARAGAG